MLPTHSHKCRLAGLSLLLLTLLPSAADAQIPAQAAAQPPDLVLKQTNPPALSDADRAKRDADKVSQWIRLVADKAAAKAPPAAAPAPVAALAKKAGPAAVPPNNNGATLAAARKQVEALAEPSAAADEPAPPPASPDPGTRMALAIQAPPALSAAPPAAPPLAEEPETPLKPLFQVPPEFPRQLVNTLQSGMVAVRFTVRTDGTVAQAEAISSSHRKLSQAAVDAVKQWRFAPIKQERTAAVEVGFKLD